jgi:hypothetical protein
MGLGIPSITGSPLPIFDGIPSITDAGSPLPIPPMDDAHEVIDSPTEELPALLPEAPDVTVPSMSQRPNLPAKPDVPDTSTLELMKLLADEDNLISAKILETASEGGPVDPSVLIDRLVKLKAAGSTPAPIQATTGMPPVRRRVPNSIGLLSRLKGRVESGQLDHLLGGSYHWGT